VKVLIKKEGILHLPIKKRQRSDVGSARERAGKKEEITNDSRKRNSTKDYVQKDLPKNPKRKTPRGINITLRRFTILYS
jgi:hypothetical protein